MLAHALPLECFLSLRKHRSRLFPLTCDRLACLLARLRTVSLQLVLPSASLQPVLQLLSLRPVMPSGGAVPRSSLSCPTTASPFTRSPSLLVSMMVARDWLAAGRPERSHDTRSSSSKPETRNPKPEIRSPKLGNPKPETRNPKPET
jgi:hypothetical protein